MFCPNCGNEIQDGTRFCGKCGNLVTCANAKNDETGNAGNINGQVTKKQFLMLGGALVVLIALTIIIFNMVRVSNPYANTKVGDTITLGLYEQDENSSNGKEAIEWQVLAVENGKALLISKYGLEQKPYNINKSSMTWEKCSLRKWLNNDFYENAFTSSEKNKIVETNVTADGNPKYDTNPGNGTYDMVFLLSINEVNRYFGSDESRMCTPTKHARDNGAWTSSSNGCSGWWLRSPGLDGGSVADVLNDGSIDYIGDDVNYGKDVVRPAMWINL